MVLAAIQDWQTFFFFLFAAIACVFALGVLFASNVVHMAFYLVLSLGATAGLFFLAGAEFVGAMQLMIYVGGTLVLLIFGVMLTAQSRFVSMKTGGGEWVIALIVGGLFLGLLLYVSLSLPAWHQEMERHDVVQMADSKSETPLGLALTGIRVDRLNTANEREHVGSGYLFPFIIVSVHLLVVLIGAAYMARTKKRVSNRAETVLR